MDDYEGSLIRNILVYTMQLRVPEHGFLYTNFPKLDDGVIALSPSFSGFVLCNQMTV